MNGLYSGNDYDDILFLPVPRSKRHAKMTLLNRAAQFAPFAALTGYEEMVRERTRLISERDERKCADAELAFIPIDYGSFSECCEWAFCE